MISIFAEDDRYLALLKSRCEEPARVLGNQPVEWMKTLAGDVFKDMIDGSVAKLMESYPSIWEDIDAVTPHLTRSDLSRNGDDKREVGDDMNELDDINDMDDADEDLEDAGERDGYITYPLEFIENRMTRWLDTPKTVLYGKSPRECVGDPRLLPSMEMLLKQVEGYNAAVFRNQQRPTYKDLMHRLTSHPDPPCATGNVSNIK